MHIRRAYLWLVLGSFGCSATQEAAPAPGEDVSTRLQGPAGWWDVEMVNEASTFSKTIDAPPEEAWSVMPAVYEALQVEVALLEPAAMRIGNPQFRTRRIGGTRLSQYLECGRGVTAQPNADRYEVTMALVTRITKADDGRAVVQSQLTASAKPRDVSGSAVPCSSKGMLEKRIVEMVIEKLLYG